MEEKFTVQKLTLKDFEDIELDPNAFKIDYLAEIAKRALDILDSERNVIKNKGKRKLSDSDERDEQHCKKEDEEKRESFDLDDHLDEQKHMKENKLGAINRETFEKGVCIIKGRVTSESETQHQQCNYLPKRIRTKKPTETVMIKRSDRCCKRNEESLHESHQEVLRRERLLKRPMAMSDQEFEEQKQKEKSKKSKNIKKLDIGGNSVNPPPPPGLPREFMETLQQFAQDKPIEEPRLVIQKKIFETDVSKTHNRLSIPKSHFQCEFLTPDEIAKLELHNGKNVERIEVDMIEPCLETSKVSFRRWNMEKKKGNPSINYVFSGTWNKLVLRNSLRAGQIVQVWSARVDGQLCFLLVRVPKRVEKNPTEAGPCSSSSLDPDQDNRGYGSD